MWSCYRDLNPGPLPYQGSALPLSYNSNTSVKKKPLQTPWAQMDSNHRRRKPADLQSAPFGHSGICPGHPLFHHRELKRMQIYALFFKCPSFLSFFFIFCSVFLCIGRAASPKQASPGRLLLQMCRMFSRQTSPLLAAAL